MKRLFSAQTTRSEILRSMVVKINDHNGFEDQLKRFWKIPETHEENENKLCEENFVRTLVRLDDGRYQVGLPFNGLELGESTRMAHARFFQLKRRLEKNPENKKLYDEGIQEYIDNSHLEEKVNEKDARNHLPHSGVL